jgi:hypothetical protein
MQALDVNIFHHPGATQLKHQKSKASKQSKLDKCYARLTLFFLTIGLLNFSQITQAEMTADDYNPYMGLSPFEQCMIYISGDKDIEEFLNEDLSGCGEKWNINEKP